MKRSKVIILTAALFCMMFALPAFAAWTGWKTPVTKTEIKTETGYVFKSGEVQIVPGAPADETVKALGNPVKVFEADSCAYQGKDVVYEYAGFELSVFPDGKTQKIASVYLNEKSQLATPEGIRIGSTVKEVQAAYGMVYTEKWGVYHFTKESTELIIYTTAGKVDAIEYRYVPVTKK